MKRGQLLVITIVVAAVAMRLAFFWISTTHVLVSGDESLSALMATGITQASDSEVFQAKQYPPGFGGRFPLLCLASPYLFPIQAYLAAPFARWLPHNAFGIRLIPALLGLLSVAFALLILRRQGHWRTTWPGGLLVLFGSAYLTMMQVAYAPPDYSAAMCFFFLVLWLVHRYDQAARRSPWLALAIGVSAGLACSGYPLSAPLLIATAAMVVMNARARQLWWSIPIYGAGALLGLSPYFAAKYLYPGAYGAVTRLHAFGPAMRRLWSPVTDFTLPRSMGISCTVLPESAEFITLIPALTTPFGYAWAALLIVTTGLSLYQFVRRIMAQHRPSLSMNDLFVAITWMSAGLFAFNTRADGGAFRFLLLAVMTFPFLVNHLYGAARARWLRVAIGGLAVLLALFNIATTGRLMQRWAEPSFGPQFTDVRPAIAHLDKQGIRYCYSSYFDAYNINYYSHERIMCSQPYNERFFTWPVPYKPIVDQADRAAYVLGPSIRFKPEDLEWDLKAAGVTYTKTMCGQMAVYENFSRAAPPPEARIDGSRLTFSASHTSANAALLNDRNFYSRWWSHGTQTPDMWIQIQLDEPTPVARVTMYYDGYRFDHANSIRIMVKQGAHWVLHRDAIEWTLEPFAFPSGFPVYGQQFQIIRFPAVTTSALRIEIVEPQAGRDWTLGEIDLYQPAPSIDAVHRPEDSGL